MLLLLLACIPSQTPPPTPKELLQGIDERGGLLPEKDPFGDDATRLIYLDQGWAPPETLWYYYADQGSALMPYKMLLKLEQADSQALLMAPENLAKFRFLLQHPTPNNPDALPVGFSRHEDRVGFTCAACHTGQLTYQGTAIRIDGAPAQSDLIGFFYAIEASLSATLADPAKLSRYATATGQPEAEARQSLQQSYDWFKDYNAVNKTTTPEGYARLDAIGRILNQVIRFTSSSANSLPPNAPASLPFLWDAPRHDYVQWTGFSGNAGPGALARNVGEVVGVYGEVKIQKYTTEEAAKAGYASSIQGHNLVAMEDSLRKLQSPLWPQEILGPLDASLSARGADIYSRECAGCHAVLQRDDPKRKVTAMVTAITTVGTDATSASNLVNATAPSGILEGAVTPDGGVYPARVPGIALLKDLDVRILSAQPTAVVQAIASAKLAGLEESPKQGDYKRKTEADPMAELLSYKARPLNGIWATAPYLHNGSVPDLYSLLLPPDQRPQTFVVGRLEYDPKRVGYRSDGSQPFVLDTRLTGNSNQGHLFGTTLSEADRLALLEYVKGL
ncbi:MAG TPA: di-heme-cytochrome C peroxidase [Myxococcota bacterium]|nr:di-heme-cytochrome C peroxidase [Myxococcota bacterium]